jgi:hypothetical protein
MGDGEGRFSVMWDTIKYWLGVLKFWLLPVQKEEFDAPDSYPGHEDGDMWVPGEATHKRMVEQYPDDKR